MRYLIFLVPLLLSAKTYMATVEPFESFTLYAQTAGKILELDRDDELKVVDKVLIKLDDSLDKTTLNFYLQQLNTQNSKLKILQNNYNKFVKIRSKSQSEKDSQHINLLDAKNAIINLKISISKLKDTIAKKSLHVKNLYVKALHVNRGDFVNQGAKLATLYDTNRAKLTIYVNKQEYKNIRNKTILIDGEKNKATFYKLDLTPDETYISSYKILLHHKSKEFGKVVKVEFVE